MGVGKSVLGNLIAKEKQIPFIDLDDYLERKEKKTIVEIFDSIGEFGFREIERKCLIEILRKKQSMVVALGGGTPCYKDNMELIKKLTVSVYLHLSTDELYNRLLLEKDKRPLISKLHEQDLKPFIEKHLDSRKAYYLQSHYTINCDNKTPYFVLKEFLKLV